MVRPWGGDTHSLIDRISLVLAGYYVFKLVFVLVPTTPDWIFFFVTCTAAAWCARNYTGSMRIFLPIFL
jgi:hypothetical protein